MFMEHFAQALVATMTMVGVVGLAVWSMVAESSIEPMGTLIGGLGTGGVLAWFLWYTTSKTIPTLVRDHRTAMEGVTKTFAVSLADERANRRQELIDERKARSEELAALRQWIKETARCNYNTDHPVGIHGPRIPE